MNIVNQEKYLNYDIIEYDVVDSTMNVIKKFSENTIIIAKKQENGRGKGNRVWSSENNNNLYFSLILNADKPNLDYSQLSFIVSVAMRQSIELVSNKDDKIVSKWPNDVLINDKKVCGILLEFDRTANTLIIGVGVNIDCFPQNIMFDATSLKNENIFINKYYILKEFLNNFNFLLNEWKQSGFSIIRNKWLRSCYRFKEDIKVNEEVGVFEDIDEDGTLILKLNDGNLKFIKSGDVF